MASACLNRIGISPENLLECSQKYSSYSWFSHRLSIGSEMQGEDATKSKTKRINSSPVKDVSDASEVSDPAKKLSDLSEEEDTKEFDGFEFRLDDPVIMLPADELFSDGKLVPMRLSVIQKEIATSTMAVVSDVRSPDTPCSRRRTDETFATVDNNNPYLFSPRAPRCSSRWKELLGFRKLQQSSSNIAKVDNSKRMSISSSSHTGTVATRSSIRQFLNRSSKSSTDSSINLPLLKETDTESVSVSSRLSLSSSSSGHDLDDLPRLSLDSDKLKTNLHLNPNNRPKTRMLKTRTQSTETRTTTHVGRSTLRRSSESTATGNRGLSVDSPRMNSSGKIVFHSLERSSSSPSNLIGGPRFKHRGMERSYSANVRITPVLNVPVCSLRGSSKSGGMFGFPIFSSQPKREGSTSSTSSNNCGSNRSQRFNGNR